jgi:hypothetical protein
MRLTKDLSWSLAKPDLAMRELDFYKAADPKHFQPGCEAARRGKCVN